MLDRVGLKASGLRKVLVVGVWVFWGSFSRLADFAGRSWFVREVE